MKWPQIAIIVWTSLELGAAMALHGKPRRAYSFWTTAITAGFLLWFLIEGGFFKGAS